jgi:hypothetical protein
VIEMVLIKMEYKIDKDKVDEYSKFVKEESLPYWLAVDGFKEMRGYRELGTGWILVEMDFDSCEAWGKVQDSEKCKEIMNKTARYTNNASLRIYELSPFTPEPLKPT